MKGMTLNNYCSFWSKEHNKVYRIFESKLAEKGMYVTFKNILRKEKVKGEINMDDIPSGIRTCLTLYLGMTNEDFDKGMIQPLSLQEREQMLTSSCKENEYHS